ncbi:MAG TPA: Mur ligase family protein [Solirubrobacteraceae bacterium]|jgi:UDP-N-acetylmuramoyl-tripeptide--D-alanyl-D-alanine ligase
MEAAGQPPRPLWTVDEVAEATGGTWLRPPGSGWNPRMVRSTLLSDILPGWREHGIVLVKTRPRLRRWFGGEGELAQEPGGCIVVERRMADSPHLPPGRAILAVDDTFTALRALAIAARARHTGRVITVTGTVGKTTTRAMLLHIFRAHGQVRTNNGDGNMRAHVFEMMASVPPDVPFVVYELGLGGPLNAFRDVSGVLRPDGAVVTQLGIAHLTSISDEPLSERDVMLAIARQKLQLCEQMDPEGTVVIDRDTPIFDDVRTMLEGRRIVSFGAHEDADYRVVGVETTKGVSHVRAEARGAGLEFDLPVPGRHTAKNALGAIVAAHAAGTGLDAAAGRLASFQAVPGRTRLLPITLGGAPITVIDDSYNATELSVNSTLEILGESDVGTEGRRIAVLGDIAHLGATSEATHAGLAEPIRRHRVDRVYTVGPMMKHLHQALPADVAAGHFDDQFALLTDLVADVRPGDVVTIKASVPSRLNRMVAKLVQADEAGATAARPPEAELPLSSVLLDGATGETLQGENAELARDPGSLAQMMTLYLLFDELRAGRVELGDELVASAGAVRQIGARMPLAERQALRLHEAILGVATLSAADAAVAIAEHLTGGRVAAFVERMNARAAELGLTDTVFATPSGTLDRRQSTTPADMARLGFRLDADFPEYRPWLSHTSMVVGGRRRPAANSLLERYEGLDGIGAATVVPGDLRHLVGSATRDGRRLIGVVMGCRSLRDRDDEMRRLLDAGFAAAAGAGE